MFDAVSMAANLTSLSCPLCLRRSLRPQSSLKKSEWEIKPEGYRDPANAAKLAAPRAQQVAELAEQAINANI